MGGVIIEKSRSEELELREGPVRQGFLGHGQDRPASVPVLTKCTVGPPTPISPQSTSPESLIGI